MRRRACRRLFASAALAAGATLAAGGAGAQTQLRLRTETGIEHDSNPSREESLAGVAPTGAPAAPAGRLVVGGDLVTAVGERLTIGLSGRGAGRLFLIEAARPDSAAVADGNAAATLAVAQRTAVAASFGYYEAFQPPGEGARDFRSLSPSGQLDQGIGDGRLALGAGYRVFTFKPEPDFDFTGPRGSLSYRHLLAPADDAADLADDGAPDEAAEWELGASLMIERRTFSGPRCVQNGLCPPDPPLGPRVDDFTAFSLDVQRTSNFLLGGGGAVHVNASNSYGAGLVRLGVYAKGAFSLPWQLTLAWRAEVATSRYSAEIPLARDRVTGLPVASIEDENRNTLRIELYRPLPAGFDLAARYVGYLDEFGSGPVNYQRHTFLLAVGWTYQPE